MDRISIILQDKTTIEELAKDPEVQIKIKDAIVDALGKRSLKLMNANAEISDAVRTVSELIKKEIINQYCDGTGWSKTLKPEYKKLIADKAATEFNNLYIDSLLPLLNDLRAKVQRIYDSGAELWEKQVNEKIAHFDFNKVIQEAVQAEVGRRLGNRP